VPKGNSFGRFAGATAAIAAAVLVAPQGAAAGGANVCNSPPLLSPGPAEWVTNSNGSLSAAVFKRPRRHTNLGNYGAAYVDGEQYLNPDFNGCTDEGNERTFPTDVISGLSVRQQFLVSRKNPFARVLTTITNAGLTPETIDFEWTGKVDQNVAAVGTSSSGDQVMDTADRWATTCSDNAANGCRDTSGEQQPRPAELAHVWQGRGDRAHSADFVRPPTNSPDPIAFEFQDVAVAPLQTVRFMQVVVLARKIGPANKAARAIDRKPRDYGVFARMSQAEIASLANWDPAKAN
jgi:hypothetical protein